MMNLTYVSQCPTDTPVYCLFSGISVSNHCHVDFYEFGLFVNGSYRNIHNGEESICSNGTLLFFQPGQSHEIHSNKPGSEHYSFIVRKDFFEAQFEKYCQAHHYYGHISKIPEYMQKKLPGAQAIYLAHLASTLAYNVSPERMPVAEHLLEIMFFALFESIPTGSRVGIDVFANDLRRAFDSYQELDTDISSLCSSYPVSQRTLLKRFRELTGHSLIDYRNMRRMEYAAHMLQKEDYSVATIANMVNVSSLSHFAKQFKKQFGMTPKQYQKLYRKK